MWSTWSQTSIVTPQNLTEPGVYGDAARPRGTGLKQILQVSALGTEPPWWQLGLGTHLRRVSVMGKLRSFYCLKKTKGRQPLLA